MLVLFLETGISGVNQKKISFTYFVIFEKKKLPFLAKKINDLEVRFSDFPPEKLSD